MKPNTENNTTYFATCPAGCEGVLAEELISIGGKDVEIVDGGVTFSADVAIGMQACLWSRVANRILKPIATVPANNANDIFANVKKIAWEEWISSLNSFAIHGIGTSPTIRHSGFMALKIKDAIVDRIRSKVGKRPNVDKSNPDVRIIAVLKNGKLSLSFDMVSDGLHRRGWRVAVHEAGIKENLAAAILLLSGYDGKEPLIDPMCGYGTFLVEAAEISAGLAPGRRRDFGFEKWPFLKKSDKVRFNALRREQLDKKIEQCGPIFGSDSDKASLDMTRKHLEKNNLLSHVKLAVKDAAEVHFPSEGGLLVCNPPYGERLEVDPDILKFYDRMGKAWRDAGKGRISVVCGNTGFRKAFGLKPESFNELFNGPIPVRLWHYRVGTNWKKTGDPVES